jgi:hypothetical protein
MTTPKALDGAAIDEVIVELKPKTRPVGHRKTTV